MDNLYSRRKVMVGAVASATALAISNSRAMSTEPVVHEIRIKSFSFSPKRLQVSVGDIIRWTNEDLAPHTATADEFGWDTGEITTNASGEIVVSEGMETSYFCAFHPHMKGALEIV